MEGADEVLRLWMIDRRLAAARGIDHGEDGRGKLDEVDAAHVGRGDEPGDIAHGSAPEGENRGGPVEAQREQLVPALLGDRERLGRLALRHVDLRHAEPRPLQAGDDRLAVEGAYRRVA